MNDLFAVIKFKGRQLYINEGDTTRTFKWTDDLQNAIWFPTGADALKTAQNYFVSFEGYEIRIVEMDPVSLVGRLLPEVYNG